MDLQALNLAGLDWREDRQFIPWAQQVLKSDSRPPGKRLSVPGFSLKPDITEMNLTPQGSKIIEELAARYFVSVDAVTSLLQAVLNGGGTMAQFSHPEFGGSGQWMQGGMTMVGDMFNNSLKAKVDGLCSELSNLLATQPLLMPAPQPQSSNLGGVSFLAAGAHGQWWPDDLGVPSSTGSQNDVRYAVFPYTHRLAIEFNGQTTVYDTLNHQIGGVGQQQGGDSSLTFSSQFGVVRVNELPIVSGQAPTAAIQVPEPSQGQASEAESDIFAKIEKLAELWQKGILSEQEFASKKSELMNRL
ncbi:SHOCT domain-containing protein [Methyloterricola oryzae]|uniref:SHOCT domain-containing protein n=1 Tax=Methyloterricola oryzae TaxID=1495050 RepID=UPI001F2AD7DB|nr:SHOCT domain-containing protein [Methyloterricola oryzae]